MSPPRGRPKEGSLPLGGKARSAKGALTKVPVIAVDGPAASGKGTVAAGVAKALGFHRLDSGSLYRLVAQKALYAGVPPDDEARLASIAKGLDVAFVDDRILLDGRDVTEAIRSEEVSANASKIAVASGVRTALLDRQHAFRRPPGLVADGRDMGTVVFPDAMVKVFVTATPEARADRRYKQLIEKGNSVNIEGLLRDIRQRDQRDAARAVAPLKPAADAVILDTTQMTVDEAIDWVLAQFRATLAKTTDEG